MHQYIAQRPWLAALYIILVAMLFAVTVVLICYGTGILNEGAFSPREPVRPSQSSQERK